MTISHELRLPYPLGDTSGIVRGDALLVFGGGTSEGFSEDIFAVCPDRSSVEVVGTIPYSSRGHQIIDLGDGTALMIGGFDGRTRNDVHRIDLTGFSAHKSASCPVSIAWFAAAVVDQKVFIVGGFTIPDGYLTSVMTYDILHDSWESVADAIPSDVFPNGAYGSNVLIRHEEHLLSFGGADSFDAGHAKTIGTVAAFNPEGRDWKAGFESIHSREGMAAARYDDDIVLVGGMSEGDQTASALVEVFDLTTGRIRARGSLALGRLTPAAGIVGNRLVVAGGVVRPLNEMTESIEVIELASLR